MNLFIFYLTYPIIIGSLVAFMQTPIMGRNPALTDAFLPIRGVCINATKLPIIIGIETDFLVIPIIYGKSDKMCIRDRCRE